MYNVVIPVDTDDDRALKPTRFLADLIEERSLLDPEDISVTVLYVFKEFKAVDDGGNVSSKDLYDEESYPDSVDDVEELLSGLGVEYELQQRHGDPADEIVQYVEETDADLTILAPRKRSSVGKMVFGSVSQEVLLSLDRPVVVV